MHKAAENVDKITMHSKVDTSKWAQSDADDKLDFLICTTCRSKWIFAIYLDSHCL